MKTPFRLVLAAVVLALSSVAAPASAQSSFERLCDTQSEDCRTPLIQLINAETQGIDVGFWFMYDSRYSNAIINRWNAGVPVRILMDDRADETKPNNGPIVDLLKNAGIPMRKRNGGGILHWKAMIFHGQAKIEFSAANYQDVAFVGSPPNQNWIDEAIYFTDDPALVNTFVTRFENMWTDTNAFVPFANITNPPTRNFPIYPLVSYMNFPPQQDYANRATGRYVRENSKIDVVMYRITDQRHSDAMIAAKTRGVAVRLITEPDEYRDPLYVWDSWNVDRMYMAGIPIKIRAHAGLMHQKSVILYGLGEVIFGSSNWTSASANSQYEHNLFYSPTTVNKPWFFQWFVDQFERKWNDPNNFTDFVPLPPTSPQNLAPVNGGAGLGQSVTLKWEGGPWAHKYDIYFGTTNTPPLLQADVAVGSPVTGTNETFTVSNLAAGTTYYWRIVGKTMADKTANGPLWSFTTAGAGSGNVSDVVLYPGKATIVSGNWQIEQDPAAAGGALIHQPNAGVPKIAAPSTNPANYFEMSFNAEAGQPYQLWFRARADNDSYNNDSVWVQFSNSLDGNGSSQWRIGTTGGIALGLEECSGCGVQAWGWHDSGYGVGVRGAPVYFSTSGLQTIRVQAREDGIKIDQLLLSPVTYLSSSPGQTKNDSVILPEAGGAVGDPPPPGTNEIVIHAKDVSVIQGDWSKVNDSSAADGVRLWNPDRGAAKVATALATPANYFEKTFNVDGGKPYHLWIRMKADADSYNNDSVWVQFSGSQTPGGSPVFRIGSTDAAAVSLEEGNSKGVQGWGWNDQVYGALGTPIYFAATGTQTIRVQMREDGPSIDQIILSAGTFLSASPGALKNDTTIVPATVGADSGSGDPPPPPSGINEIVLYASDVAPTDSFGNWTEVSDASAAGNLRLWNADQGAAKLNTALGSPADYFTLTFNADAGKPYHLWLRMKADANSYQNDSVYVQFDGSVDQNGTPTYRIFGTDAAAVSLENGSGAGVSGWGWNDNAYDGFGPSIYFATSGPQTMRIQRREDGVSIDQVVLSAYTYLTSPPGTYKNDTTIVAKPVTP